MCFLQQQATQCSLYVRVIVGPLKYGWKSADCVSRVAFVVLRWALNIRRARRRAIFKGYGLERVGFWSIDQDAYLYPGVFLWALSMGPGDHRIYFGLSDV